MGNIQSNSGNTPITPRERKMYEQEYRQGAELFQNALQQYVKSDNVFQQKEFQGVMDKALSVLNETAQGLHRKALIDQNTKIEKDYAAFNNTPTDQRVIRQLEDDLNQAKKHIS
ncbi:MAG: hypothetical protein HY861_03955 [Chlamydiia bacterium]|nr:hypothetical protein [Chlamydiia bacterium]